MKEYTFGIVLPTFNRLDSLTTAIDSVLNQTYDNWKLTIVDDSSNEETYQWSLKQTFDPRITYRKNDHNQGVGFSRNAALDLLVDQVDFIVFLDDDDCFDEDCLLNANTAINQNSSFNWHMSRRVSIKDKESITVVNEEKDSYDYIEDLLFGNAIRRDATHFISSQAIRSKNARFDERIKSGGEWRFFIQIGKTYPINFFEGGITYGDYLPGGLSDLNKKNIQYKLEEHYDLYKVLREQNIFPDKQVKLIHKVVRFARKLKNRDVIKELGKEKLNQLPTLSRFLIRLKLLSFSLILSGSRNTP